MRVPLLIRELKMTYRKED